MLRSIQRGVWICFAGLMVTACKPDTRVDPGLSHLAKAFRAANQAKDIGPMLELYELKGTDNWTVSMLKAALKYELGLPIAAIEFEPLSGAPEEVIDFTHDGVQYGPSLEPGYRMRVRYDVEDGLTSLYTVGQRKDGSWRIVCSRPLPAPVSSGRY
ncbi:hypothetical protein [Coraliomargarita parva]|uniref:hypothetical protein n=1 Tax=Coraliomargarita parva TaxID=3014050 RepID=UPI0022B41659|nr:hypothetical protein [Coraliomargarita parva]